MPVSRAIRSRKCAGQQGYVLLALAQRRNTQVDDAEAVVKILAEAPLLHHRRQIAVGGRQNTDVDGDAMGSADRADLLFLQGAQQLGLQIKRQLANLIEKDRASLGRSQQTVLGTIGAGERAFHVAEELTLHQRGHQGTAVDGNERAIGVGAIGMNRARHQLLAHAALSQDQHRVRALRHLGQNAVELVHLRAAADHVAQALGRAQGFAQPAAGAFHRALRPFHRPLQHRGQFIHGKGLGEIIGGPGAHRLDRGGHRSVRCHHHHAQVRIERLDLVQQAQAFAEWGLQIEQQDVDTLIAQQGTRRRDGGNSLRHKAKVSRYLAARRTNGCVLVDHQKMKLAGALHGSRHSCHRKL